MNRLNKLVGLVALALVLTVPAKADQGSYARVVKVETLYGQENRQECRVVTEQVQQSNDAGAVLGAIAGAALGNQIGKGGGKDVATVVGGIVGYQVGKGPEVTREQQRTVCTLVPVQVKIGERVWFRYRHRQFSQDFMFKGQ